MISPNRFGISFRRTAFATSLLAVLLAGAAMAQERWEMRVCADPNRLPYSSREEPGYDNVIAEILANELGADLEFVWLPTEQLDYVATDYLYVGECDLVLGLQDGEEGFLHTAAYYRSRFAFVHREDDPLAIESFDDPQLRELRVGVLGSPALAAFNQRGMRRQVESWDRVTDYGDSGWLGGIIRAVAEGELDVAVAWGPVAGFFAERQEEDLVVTPVPQEIEPPRILMVRSMTIGLRPGDLAFRDRLDVALARRWTEIQEVLESYGVPLSNLPRPTGPLRGGQQ